MCHTRAKKIFDQCIGIYKNCPKQPRTEYLFYRFFYPMICGTVSGALTVHCDSSRQKGDKDKPNILVSFVSNIAALRLMWHHNFSLSNFEEMMAFKKLFLVYKVHFFSFEQDLLYKKTKKGKVMMLCIALQPCQSWQKICFFKVNRFVMKNGLWWGEYGRSSQLKYHSSTTVLLVLFNLFSWCKLQFAWRSFFIRTGLPP